jgi:7-cyano-7-deazaguanine synthase in queuosine biosynthesis
VSELPWTWVLCGDAEHPDATADALRIDLGGQLASMTVNIDGLSEPLAGKLTAEFHDLIRIASFVLGADGAVDRGKEEDITDERWCRRFRFVVDVANPTFWNREDVTATLERVLGFVSQDTFRFEFQPTPPAPKRRGGEQLVFAGEGGKPFVPWDDIQDVSMFSGGLDSFSGAAELVLTQRRRAVLVTHCTSTKVKRVQKDLVQELCAAARTTGAPVPVHVSLDLERHDSRLRQERTQRTRSFLYAAIAGAVANLIGRDRVLMYENGVIAINLPLVGSIVGARATRTAHPHALAGFGELLTLVARRELRVHNPFALKTRTEIIAGLGASPALPLAQTTLSCAHAHMGTTEYPQCGRCSQCIDRQFGFIAAGLEAQDDAYSYEVKLATDEWKEAHRQLLLDWIAAADRFAACPNHSAFVQSFGEASRAFGGVAAMFGISIEAAAERLYDLHKRHGDSIAQALATLHARYADRVRRGELRPQSLLMLLYRQGIEKQVVLPPAPDSAAANQFLRRNGGWRIRFRDGKPFDLFEPRSLQWLSYMVANPGRVFTAGELWAIGEGRDPAHAARLDDAGQAEVVAQKRKYEGYRVDAEEFSDAEAVARWTDAAGEMDAALARSASAAPLATDAARTAQAMERHLSQAVATLRKHSPPLVSHFEECVHVGHAFWYAGTVVPWAVEQPLSLTTPSAVGTRRLNEQLVGWNEILPALGRENSRSNRELIRQLSEDLGGPIKKRGLRGVIANANELAVWSQTLADRADVAARKASVVEKQAKATKSQLANRGERKDLGYHEKDRPNTRRRGRQ